MNTSETVESPGCLASAAPACSPTVTEVVYRWPDGREEVRYRRPFGTSWACDMILEVDQLIRRLGPDCPYSYRHV